MADHDWPPVEDNWPTATTDEKIPVTEGEPAVTTDESKSVTDNWPAATDNWPAATTDGSKEKATTTWDAPASNEPTAEKSATETAEALPVITFPGQNGIVVFTDSEGKLAAIGALKVADFPPCAIRLGTLHQNRETCFSLQARFPMPATADQPSRKNFQRMWLNFFGDAFENIESDVVISKVEDVKELPDLLAKSEAVIKSVEKNLHKLCFRYQTNKVVAKAKNAPESFALEESSHAARQFKYLVDREGTMSFDLYIRATHDDVETLEAIKGRLKLEKDIKPFPEYRDKNGKIVIQWNSSFGTWCDVRSRLPSELNFRFPEQHAVTLAYGEIRDHAYMTLIARSTLEKSVSVSFVAVPGCTDEKGVTHKYLGFVDMPESDAVGQLFQPGTNAKLCFTQPLTTVEPEGWMCTVKPDFPTLQYPGNLVLFVVRNDDREIKVAKRPSLDMREASEYDVWLYPEGSDKPARRMVDCALKLLHGDPDESPGHRKSREDLQQFCSGLDFSKIPPAPANFFNESDFDAVQRRRLESLKGKCSPEQRIALAEILSSDSSIHMIQGPPGTGKTYFITNILMEIFAMFGKTKVNCYCPSNAATDVLAGNIPEGLNVIRYHGLNMESNAVEGRAPGDRDTDVTDKKASGTPPKDKAKAALSEDDQDFFRMYIELTQSDPWKIPVNKFRRHLDFISLYIRALQFVGVMGADRHIPRTIPDTIRPGFEKWARYFYSLDELPEKKPLKKYGTDDDDVNDNDVTYRQLTVDLFNATLENANIVVTTCSNAADELLRNATKPEIVIIDEAGVSKELESLMPIYYNLATVKKVIIVGDQQQLRPPVYSHNRRLIGEEDDGLPYNIFGSQLTTPLMTRQIDNGMPYVMFKIQYRMTAGIEELSSRMCHNRLLENDVSTSLAHRPQSLAALQFLQDEFGVTTEFPDVFINVPNGVCIRGSTKSRSNPPNVIIDMVIVQAVLRAGNLFYANEICIITPYKAQASLIRDALWKAGNDEYWLARGIRNIRVHTVDSMQGGESPMVIVDSVLAKRRKGRYGFMINRGRINIAVSRAKYFQVFVGDMNALDAAQKDPNKQEAVPDPTVAPNEDNEDDDQDVTYWESTLKPIKLLYDHYRKNREVVDIDHEDKPQRSYVDLTASDALLNTL